VFRIAREFQDIPQGDAHVLEYFPGRMIGSFWAFPAKVRRQVFDGRIEIDVGASALQKIDHVVPQRFVVWHDRHSFRL